MSHMAQHTLRKKLKREDEGGGRGVKNHCLVAKQKQRLEVLVFAWFYAMSGKTKQKKKTECGLWIIFTFFFPPNDAKSVLIIT